MPLIRPRVLFFALPSIACYDRSFQGAYASDVSSSSVLNPRDVIAAPSGLGPLQFVASDLGH
jgi:hypothetical protein